MLVRDILAYRKRVHLEAKEIITNNRKKRMYLNVLFHNKGIEMLNLPGILHRSGVKKTVPTFLDHKEPPTVTYTYTKTTSCKIFNYKNAVSSMDFDIGTLHMTCGCRESAYMYAPTGHVVTGDLNIIQDRALRHLLKRGPTFREQNNINWEINRRICKGAVWKYREKWAKKEYVDERVLDEWVHSVYDCIDKKIDYLVGKLLTNVSDRF